MKYEMVNKVRGRIVCYFSDYLFFLPGAKRQPVTTGYRYLCDYSINLDSDQLLMEMVAAPVN